MEPEFAPLPGNPGVAPPNEDRDRFKERFDPVAPHPWLRFFARMIDVQLWAIPVFTLLAAFQPLLPKIPDVVTGMVSLFLFNFAEATAFALFGTTIGKWFLKIEVRTATGDQLTFGRALGRVFSVWIYGMGFGIPVVNLFAMALSHGHLNRNGRTRWDREGRFQVTYGSLGIGRRIILTLLVVLYLGLSIAGTIMQRTGAAG